MGNINDIQRSYIVYIIMGRLETFKFLLIRRVYLTLNTRTRLRSVVVRYVRKRRDADENHVLYAFGEIGVIMIFITIVEIDNRGCGRVTGYTTVYMGDDSARIWRETTSHEGNICTGRSLPVFERDSRGSPKFARLKPTKKL